MTQAQLTFWGAIVQIIPVLALALIVEFAWLREPDRWSWVANTRLRWLPFVNALWAFAIVVTSILAELRGIVVLLQPVTRQGTAIGGWEYVAVAAICLLISAALFSPAASFIFAAFEGTAWRRRASAHNDLEDEAP